MISIARLAVTMWLDRWRDIRGRDEGASTIEYAILVILGIVVAGVIWVAVSNAVGQKSTEITNENNNPAAGEVFLTTDTQFAPSQIMDFYRRASIVFQDCETSPYKSGVHAHYSELKTLPGDIRAKMWLYHYQDGALPDAQADGFAGFVKQGQVFEF